MFKLLSSTAIAAVLASGTAMAQYESAQPMANEPAGAIVDDSASENFYKADEAAISEDLIGAEVVNANGESLGEIEELIVAIASADSFEPLETAPPADITAAEPPKPIDDGGDVDHAAETGADSQAAPTDDMAAAKPAEDGGEAGYTAESSESAQDLSTDEGATSDQMAETGETPNDGLSDETAATEPADSQASDELAQGESDLVEDPAIEDDTAASEPLPSEGETVMAPSAPADQGDVKVTDLVLGVGGFLGIGEKRVAVPVDRFEFLVNDDGDHKIVLNVSAEELDSMPDYVERDDGISGTQAPAEPLPQ